MCPERAHEDLVDVPAPDREDAQLVDAPVADLRREHLAKPAPQEAHFLVADFDIALMPQFLDVLQRKSKL